MKLSAMIRGRSVKLSPQRRLTIDLLALSRDVPVGGGYRPLRVREAAEARRALRQAPGWSAMLLKAYALVAVRRKELRYCLLRWPWQRFYEFPVSVCAVVTERDWNGENTVFIDQIVAPENMGLDEIQYHLTGLRTWPIESVGGYRRVLRFLKLPGPLRRFLLRLGLNLWGPAHARYFGTFSINSLGAPRLEITQSMTPLTGALFHGITDPDGHFPVFMFFDHRVVDGMTVARFSSEVETVMNGAIAAELRAMATAPRWRPTTTPAPGPR